MKAMIQRALYRPIQDHLGKKEMTLIIGPRQAGKTTIMRLLQAELARKGKKTLFLSLDTETDRPFFASQQSLLQKISIEVGPGKAVIFLDEIQRKENAGIFLKGLYDMDLPYKFVISGSGSVELKEKIHESLVGRKRIFEVFTLSFAEFADYRLGYQYSGRLEEFFSLHKERTSALLSEYLNFGGYPRVTLADTIEEKRLVIADIYQSYLEKDIALLLNIQKTESLTQLVRILASQVGSLINLSELSNTLGISSQTVKDYLWYLEKTFIIHRLTPYSRNIRKEVTKMGTAYFVDLGLKNYAHGQFGNALVGVPSGFLFENLVYNALRTQLTSHVTTIHFWRTQDKAEVDFVLSAPAEVIPVEVKYQVLTKPETTRSFKSFLNKYQPKRAYIVHLGEQFEEVFEQTTIKFLPYYAAGKILADLP